LEEVMEEQGRFDTNRYSQKQRGQERWEAARTLARKVELSHASVQRIWAAHGSKPHLTKTFKLSSDKQFVEKLTDMVGLYLNPPERRSCSRSTRRPRSRRSTHTAGPADEEGPGGNDDP
jgi:hypothetical protein